MQWGVPYGFDEDAETWSLLRSSPDAATLDWVAKNVGGRVVEVEPLRGGLSSAVHRVRVGGTRGASRNVVLRRYVRPELNVEEPDLVAHEAAGLRWAETLAVPTPSVLAIDATGAECGVPTLLMSHLPGSIEWQPDDVDAWLRGLAEVLPLIHTASRPPRQQPAQQPRPFLPYEQDDYRPPTWAKSPRTWERAAELVLHRTAWPTTTFIHRDFHPGNVLWRSGSVSGVVDWSASCLGDPATDVGHCRVNLLYSHGPAAARQFTATWEDICGTTYDPWADVVEIMGFLDELRTMPQQSFPGIEEMLGSAVCQLT